MKINIKGVYAKKKELRSGAVRYYYYHRATGTRLPDDPISPEFHAAVRALNGRPVGIAPAGKTFSHLVREYRTSLGYHELGTGTQQEYDRHIRYLEPTLGSFPVARIERKHLEKIMSKYAETPTLARAIGRTMSVLFTYALDKLQWIPGHPFLKMGNQRVRNRNQIGQRPYGESEIPRFRQKNPLGSRERLAFEIALATALRIGDIVNVPAAEMMSETMPVCIKKTGEIIAVPVGRQMREAWLAWEETRKAAGGGESRYAVCSLDGSSLHKSTLSHEMRDAYIRAEFDEGQRTHALRYTACIRLFELGFSFADIAEHTGHRMASMAAEYCRKRRNAAERGIALEAFEDIQGKALSDALKRTGAEVEHAKDATADAASTRRRLH